MGPTAEMDLRDLPIVGTGINDMTEMQQVHYKDQTVRWFVLATILWGAVGMLVGLIAAAQLAWWQLNGGVEWLTFGRLRPIHTNGVIFAFVVNAIFAGVYHSAQRVLRSPIVHEGLAKFHFWLWQVIVVLDVVFLAAGFSQGKEYAEPGLFLDILITVAWVVFALNVFWMIAKRKEKHIYVAIWFYIATLITIAVLHLVENIAVPVDFFHSYSIFPGVQDAMIQWWYGHNAVGFLLTTPFLGMMYYYLPKVANRPVFSYRLSILHFWSLVFLYIWAGPHHLHYTALPDWTQSLGMVFSVMLWAPSWGGMVNGLYTLRGAFHRLRDEPILKFLVVAITFYGMSTFEGPLMSVKTVNSLSHYTDWNIGHVHSGALGWVAFLIFGVLYYMIPKLWNTKLYSTKLANVHFWTGTIGIVLYVVSMWIAGVTQGLMWRQFSDDGVLTYSFIETVTRLMPMYHVRVLGGTLFLFGFLVMIYNVAKTIGASTSYAVEGFTMPRQEHDEQARGHGWLEVRPFVMAAAVTVVILIGGLVELMPLLLVDSTVPKLEAVKPYTPLELHGRSIYVAEGCYTCHSQMIRPFRFETERYGAYAKPGEFAYDHPHQWGSKRTGPDLQRLGGKYNHAWHYRHLEDPRSTSPSSIMPSYQWLLDDAIDYPRLAKTVAAMQSIGVPYSDEEVANAESLARTQAADLAAALQQQGVGSVKADTDVLAMIAYLQRLGMDTKPAQAAAAGAQ